MPWDSSCNTDVSPDTPLFEARQQQHKLGQQETNSLKLAKQSLKLKGSGLSILSDGVESPEEDDLMDQEERPVESFVRPVPLTAEDIEAELGEQEKRQDDTGIVRVMRGSRSADDISRIQSLVEIYHHRMPSTIMEEPMDTGDDEDDNSKNQKLPHPLKRMIPCWRIKIPRLFRGFEGGNQRTILRSKPIRENSTIPRKASDNNNSTTSPRLH